MQKIRKYKIEGTAELIGRDGELHRKIMIRVSPHGYKREHWLDVPDGAAYRLGDVIKARRNPPYVIVEDAEGGKEDEHHDSCG